MSPGHRPAPRRVPVLAWEPLPFIAAVVLLAATGIVRPESPPWLFWPFTAILLVVLVWLFVSLLRGRRQENPDRWGNLSSFDDLELLDVEPPAGRELRTVSPVDDALRHQPSIDLARLDGGTEQRAVLVPRARRWMSPRYRIGVQLVGGVRPRHVGFLGRSADERWRELLDALAREGRYVSVPAAIVGTARPMTVELDLAGLPTLEAPGTV